MHGFATIIAVAQATPVVLNRLRRIPNSNSILSRAIRIGLRVRLRLAVS